MKLSITIIALSWSYLLQAQGGTVTSVDLSASPMSIFNVSGGPITTSGTLGLSLDNQSATTFLAGPLFGSSPAAPAFRSLDALDLPLATISQQGAVSTTAQTFGGIKTFDNNVLIYNAGSYRKLGINTNTPTYVFDMRPANSDNNNPIFMVRNAAGGDGFLLSLEGNNMRMGILDSIGNTQAKFRSNGISYVALKYEVGENLQDVENENPQFKVLGTQNYVTDKSDMTNYQQTIQHHSNTSGQSAAIGFGVDQGFMEEGSASAAILEIDNQKIGAYIAFTRTGTDSEGDLHIGVKGDEDTQPEDVLVIADDNVNFPNATASTLAVFDASENLVSGTAGNGVTLTSGTLALDINELSTLTNVDPAADYVPVYDASSGNTNKTLATNLSPGYVLQGSTGVFTPANNTTIYFGSIASNAGTATADINRIYIPRGATIRRIDLFFYYGTAATSAATSNIYIRRNNANPDVTASSSILNTTGNVHYTNTTSNPAPSTNDYFEFKWITPDWAATGAGPADMSIAWQIYLE